MVKNQAEFDAKTKESISAKEVVENPLKSLLTGLTNMVLFGGCIIIKEILPVKPAFSLKLNHMEIVTENFQTCTSLVALNTIGGIYFNAYGFVGQLVENSQEYLYNQNEL